MMLENKIHCFFSSVLRIMLRFEIYASISNRFRIFHFNSQTLIDSVIIFVQNLRFELSDKLDVHLFFQV